MEYTTVVASKPGVLPPKFEKRTNDSKIFMIDCSSLLMPNELIFGDVGVSHTNISITEVQSRQGKFIKFRVSGGPTNIPHADYLISFTVTTSAKNELTVPISIRVFSN